MSNRRFRNNHSGEIHPEYAGGSSQTNFPSDWTEVLETRTVEPVEIVKREVEPVVEIVEQEAEPVVATSVDVSTPAIPPAPQAKAKSNGNKRGSN